MLRPGCGLRVRPLLGVSATHTFATLVGIFFRGLMPESRWRGIVAIAGRCPSTHNTQGWRVRANDDDTLTLFFDRRRTLPDEDTDGAFNIVNMGVFTRGMEIAAAAQGYGLRYTFALDEAGEPRRYTKVATLALDGNASDEDAAMLEPFERRRTARIPYDGRRIPEDHLQALKVIAAGRDQLFAWTQDPNEVRWHLELNVETIIDDLQSRPIRREIELWTRLTRGHAERARDGLWARCMNQKPLDLWMGFRFPWMLKLPVLHGMFKRMYLRTQAGTPAVGWLVGSVGEREQQFELGRFMLDWWLEVTKRDVFVLPFGSVYTNPASHALAGERIGAPNFWIIMRMGYCDPPPKSFRLDPDDLWIA